MSSAGIINTRAVSRPSAFAGTSHALPLGRVLEDGTSGWRRKGPDLETDRALGCGQQLGEEMGEVMKSPDPLKHPIGHLKGKSGWLPCGWCVTSSVTLEEANTLYFDSQERELWEWFSEKEHESLESDPNLKLSPAPLLTV